MATVLVVDDRATNREVARAALAHGGYSVVEAADGDQALNLAHGTHPDVIVADVLMPGMDGYEFVQRLRNAVDTADIPVLFYTANYRPDEAAPLGGAFGVTQVVPKSADPMELVSAVEKALHEKPDCAAEPAPHGFATRHLHALNVKLVEKVQALAESRTQLTMIAELSPIGIAVADATANATYINPRLAEILGRPAKDLLGVGWLVHLPAELHRKLLDPAGAKGTVRGQWHNPLADGGQQFLSIAVRHIYDEDHRHTGFAAAVEDITALLEEQERRHAAHREREAGERRRIAERYDSLARLSRGVAHDFNNLLSVILSFQDFVREAVTDAVGQPLDEPAAQAILADLDKIDRAGRRGADLAQQLLTFGGRQVVQPAVVNVNDIVREVCAVLSESIGANIDIDTELEPDLHHVRADPAQLSQVLFKLAYNARDAMAEGGRLTLHSGNLANTGSDRRLPDLPAGDYVHVAVVDSGTGMPPEVAERAMEPFFTTKPKGHNSGLGLATAYGIVRQAGGDLAIESRVGAGTTVHVYLPATDQRPGPSRVAPVQQARSGATILLAEDEDAVREAVSRTLTGAGYHVLSAADGEEALSLADQHRGRIDLLLTDVVMRRVDGPQLAATLRLARPGTPVLYMSGYAAPLMTEQGTLEPGVTVLNKPFTKPDLLAAIESTLDGGH